MSADRARPTVLGEIIRGFADVAEGAAPGPKPCDVSDEEILTALADPETTTDWWVEHGVTIKEAFGALARKAGG